MKRRTKCIFFFLFFLFLSQEFFSSITLAVTPDDRRKLCIWIVTHPLAGLRRYEEYLCDGKIVTMKTSEQSDLGLHLALFKEDNDKTNTGIRLVWKYHFSPYYNRKKENNRDNYLEDKRENSESGYFQWCSGNGCGNSKKFQEN